MALESTQLLTEMSAVPLQAWSGPEGYRKLRFPDFMTMAQDGGKVVSLTHRNRNEYQEYFPGGKGGLCIRLTTFPPSCVNYLEVLEPKSPETVRECPGIALPA